MKKTLLLLFTLLLALSAQSQNSCRILYSNTNCLNTSYMCDNFNDVRAVSGPFLFIIDNNIR